MPYEPCSDCDRDTHRGPDHRLMFAGRVVCSVCMERLIHRDMPKGDIEALETGAALLRSEAEKYRGSGYSNMVERYIRYARVLEDLR